ncbi:site-specific integrase [Marinomonas sp. M1K-6]|uniref:Site-specific integrase n=1 Tax=Marinomonas profundi TaxID=2726122 RepID=A0A847R6M8_9GAMM|nr:site-specific integrase [Marinomonas profundi]NLQ16747.1 site-specific integrase [Marinomonas profundi]UDV03679.1 site-specific integrase [Marinomonas profundi]
MISIDLLNRWQNLEQVIFLDKKSATLAEIVLEAVDDKKIITNSTLMLIKKNLVEHYKLFDEKQLTRTHLKEVNNVISKLEAVISSVVFFDLIDKVVRPTVISPDLDQSEFRIIIQEIASSTQSIFKSNTFYESEALYILLLIDVAMTTGLTLPRAEIYIKGLLRSPFEDKILIPSGESERPDKCLPIIPSNITRFLCVCLRNRNYTPPKKTKYERHIISVINKSTNIAIEPPKIKMKAFYSAATNFFTINGTEAILYSRLSGRTLPVAPPWGDEKKSIIGKPSTHINHRNRTKKTLVPSEKKTIVQRDKELKSYSDEFLDDEEMHRRFLAWQEIAYFYLGHLRYWIKNQTLKFKSHEIEIPRLISHLNRSKTKTLFKMIAKKTKCNPVYIENLNDKIEDKAHKSLHAVLIKGFPLDKDVYHYNDNERPFCAISLMFLFVHYELVVRKNKVSTVLSKLTNLFSRGLFDYEPSINIEDWDEEDSSLFIHEILINPDLAENTNHSRLSQFSTLLNFNRSKLDLWTEVYFPVSQSGELTTTNRHQVLGQQEFNLFMDAFTCHHNVKSDITVSTVIFKILFYAGLRPGELARLTLGDISANSEEEILIRVRRFKTPASRRTIPLHLLAPPEVCLEIFEYISQRLNLFSKLKMTRAFGKDRKSSEARERLLAIAEVNDEQAQFLRTFPLFSNAEKVTRIAREEMKLILGEGADLYLLRHSYATHMFLRWYAMRYPGVINELRDRNEWFYSNEALALQRHIYRHGSLVNHSKETDMVHLMKSMGHRFVDTFFAVYCHSYFVVYNHAQKKYMAQRGWENLPVSTGFIQANIPKMKSRTTISQIKEKSLVGVLEFFQSKEI